MCKTIFVTGNAVVMYSGCFLSQRAQKKKRLYINQWYEGEEAIYIPTCIYTNFKDKEVRVVGMLYSINQQNKLLSTFLIKYLDYLIKRM